MKAFSSPPSPVRHLAATLLTLPLAAGSFAAETETAQPTTPPAKPATETEPAPQEQPAAEPAKAEKDATSEASESAEKTVEDLKNWVELGVGGTFVSGHKPAYQQRYGLPDGAFGGVDGFHYERGFGKNGRFEMDGRGIFDNHDYKLNIGFDVPNKGYLRVSYGEDRNWQDASGGFLPPTQAWYALYPDALAYDDRDFSVEAGLRLPKIPKFTLRYAHTEREGEKSSTVWGAGSNTGGLGLRSIVPTVLDLDRDRDLVTADLTHRIKSTDVGLGVRYERQDNDDARLMRQSPGAGPGLDRHVTERDQSEADLFNVHAHTVSRLNSKLTVSAGYAYTDLNTDTSGYRAYGPTFDPEVAQRLPAPNTFDNLIGGSVLQQHVGNLNLMANLAKKLVLVPSLRIESRQTEGQSLFLSPAVPFTGSSYEAQNSRGLLDVSEALDLRYTGITNWVFYAQGSWLQGQGDLQETRFNRDTGAWVLDRETDDERMWQKYTGGANWYPWRRVSFGAEYYHKRRANDYDHAVDSTPNRPDELNRYPAFLRAQNFVIDDVNCRVTWRPRGNLSVVGRYDLQLSTVDTRPDNLAEIQTADLTSYIGSGSVSWVPLARLYVQGTLSYVWDHTTTPASDLLAAVQNADNDYWTGLATLGYALDDRTDLEGQYRYYRADNYSDNSAYGQAYGAGSEEHGLTAGVVRRLSPRVRVSLKYGFFTSHDELSGSKRDYDAHMVYSTVQYRF